MTSGHGRHAAAGPMAVGGVGGSGTRLIAAMLRELNVPLGTDLNGADDNLRFTLLFKWPGVLEADDRLIADLWDLFQDPAGALQGGYPRSGWPHWDALLGSFVYDDGLEFDRDWRCERVRHLRAAAARAEPGDTPWAWKEPNTHLVIDRLLGLRADLRYLHVMRNGLDMAFSGNQTQLRLWGEALLGRPVAVTPADSLTYWVAAHRRIQRIAQAHPGRVMLLNYDALCLDPEARLPALLRFLGRTPDRATLDRLRPLIAPPESIGRHRAQDTSDFDPDDVAYVRHLGFDAEV